MQETRLDTARIQAARRVIDPVFRDTPLYRCEALESVLGIAAILEDRDRFVGRHVVTIVCGSNVDLDAYHRWVVQGRPRFVLADAGPVSRPNRCS